MGMAKRGSFELEEDSLSTSTRYANPDDLAVVIISNLKLSGCTNEHVEKVIDSMAYIMEVVFKQQNNQEE